MKFVPQSIPDVIKIIPKTHQDIRGEFMETFKASTFNDAVGEEVVFVQDNESLSVNSYTIRGLHYQSPPVAQGKLIRCTQGEIVDIVVDVRKKSSTYGKSVSAILSPKNKCQIWVPEGFLHGFSTLQPNTIVQYKSTAYYTPECEGSVMWNDPDLNLDWGVKVNAVTLSQSDKDAIMFKIFDSPF